jgi:O-antigen/teichoic acid export membrane protein
MAEQSPDATATTTSRRKVAGQGALLFGGFAAAQSCSFLRNAIFGYALSKGDFGIAATITLALQMLDTLSDLGADRLLVQAKDGDEPRLMAVAHLTLVVRGLITAAILYTIAGPVAQFFGIAHAQSAFELVALVPLIRGVMHLDPRRYQRRLDNRAYMLVETLPQAMALGLAVPMLWLQAGYEVVVWIAIAQALMALALSHLLAERGYRLSADWPRLKRLIAFGWPIWLSAFPLIAVFQADRAIIGTLFGMETLAGFTAAFMVTMVPGLIVAKVGHALMLPLLAAVRNDTPRFLERARLLSESAALLAAGYLAIFIVAGGALLPLAFGPNYTGLGLIVGWLAVMWAIRMIQAVPGMALMAEGHTRPLLTAGMLRATSLLLALSSVPMGFGLVGIAAAGVVGEVMSLVHVTAIVDQRRPGFARLFYTRALLLVAAIALATVTAMLMPAGATLAATFAVAMVVAVAALCLGLATMPALRLALSQDAALLLRARPPVAPAE